MILYVPNRVGALFHGFYHDPENIFFVSIIQVYKVKTASLARVHDEAKSFNLFLVKSHLLWLPFQNKKVLHDMKNRRYFFFEFSSRCKGAYETPRGEKITHGDPTETEMSNLCAASFEGFWTRFVMDRCRANTF